MNKIPVFSTVGEIFKETFCDMKRYGFIAWFWLLIIGAMSFFSYDVAMMLAIDENSASLEDLNLIISFLAMYAISTLSAFLITSNFLRASMEERTVLKAGGKDLLFLIMSLIIILCLFVLFILMTVVIGAIVGLVSGLFSPSSLQEDSIIVYTVMGVIVAMISLAVVFFIWVRLSLIFADIFAKDSIGIVKCWKKTKGNFWRLFMISFIIGLPFVIPNSMMPAIEYDAEGKAISGLDGFAYKNAYIFAFTTILWAGLLPLMGTMLAVVYKKLVYTSDENKVSEENTPSDNQIEKQKEE